LSDITERAERDKKLFEDDGRRQLARLLPVANPRISAGAIIKALEWQIAMEEYARSQGVEFESDDFIRFRKENYTELAKHLERAVSGFIGAIVSQEG